ncbi:unnamed protein product, partial [Tetraodon nigroviridis]
ALSDPSSRLSTSPPPPAIAVPLLEMGFSLRQITKALEATGARGEADAQNITVLAMWMIEHPGTEDERDEPHGRGGVAATDPTRARAPRPRPEEVSGAKLVPGLFWRHRHRHLRDGGRIQRVS